MLDPPRQPVISLMTEDDDTLENAREMRGDVVHVKKTAGVSMCDVNFLSGFITSGLPSRCLSR